MTFGEADEEETSTSSSSSASASSSSKAAGAPSSSLPAVTSSLQALKLSSTAVVGDGLAKQTDAKLVDVKTLTLLTPEVISRQATINIGTIGHVAHGKSTVVKAISGVKVCLFDAC